ncbi:redoxin domain-containing protein [Rhodoplanes sp. TEM]|uniref:Redoxin domain-containing protein n=1 Tax=Rhodoplanes tepidamans TaxID=200616 RepID=A0ABT5J8Y6_RHOTP|nr:MULTISPECIES: redoxin domain-containing protein [Rhodoplanes]MDC7786121.1 redoxin domain-containing protein [Rhodoplanes tepidamans]MDC7982788.1 redoxin domain-containing protein [Rhodoplanes sp. TEM]MDQ0357214.1 peroxiredoxin [Rhodoplanes tepidamans]
MSEPRRSAFECCRDMDASLCERLDALDAAFQEQFPGLQEVTDRLVARLRASGVGAAAPQVGDPMPDFLLPDCSGRLVGLDDLLEDGPVALVFHRGHWCSYCRLSVDALAEASEAARAAGLRIVAVVPDIQEFAAAFAADAHGAIPVLCDVDNGYAASLNLVVWMGDEMLALTKKAGVDLPRYQGNDSWSLPIPAAFVIGRDRRILARFVDPDYRRRMPIEDMLAAARRADAAAR